jgi:hypothetical protein
MKLAANLAAVREATYHQLVVVTTPDNCCERIYKPGGFYETVFKPAAVIKLPANLVVVMLMPISSYKTDNHLVVVMELLISLVVVEEMPTNLAVLGGLSNNEVLVKKLIPIW